MIFLFFVWLIGAHYHGRRLMREYDSMHTQIRKYWHERLDCYVMGIWWPITLPLRMLFKG